MCWSSWHTYTSQALSSLVTREGNEKESIIIIWFALFTHCAECHRNDSHHSSYATKENVYHIIGLYFLCLMEIPFYLGNTKEMARCFVKQLYRIHFSTMNNSNNRHDDRTGVVFNSSPPIKVGPNVSQLASESIFHPIQRFRAHLCVCSKTAHFLNPSFSRY